MKLRINKYTVIYALLICTFFPPAKYIIPTRITIVPRYIACFIILLVFLARYCNSRLNKRVISMLFYFVYIFLLSSLINYKNVEIESTLRWFSASISFILLAEMGLTVRPKAYLRGLLIGAGIPCLINMYTMFRYASSHGMYYGMITTVDGSISGQAWYYFTHANAAFFIVFPILIAVYYYVLAYSEKKVYVVHIISIITFISYAYANSTTSMIVLLAFCLYMLLLWNPKEGSFIRRKIGSLMGFVSNKWFILSFIAIAIILIVFFHITDRFAEVIEMLGKSADLTHRLPVWAKIIQILEENKIHLIFGYGWENELVTVGKLGINHCHNILLEILYRGGILGVLLFVLFTIHYLCGLRNTKMGRLLGIGLIIYLFCSIMDFYLYRYELYLIYVMIAHSYKFEENLFFREKSFS